MRRHQSTQWRSTGDPRSRMASPTSRRSVQLHLDADRQTRSHPPTKRSHDPQRARLALSLAASQAMSSTICAATGRSRTSTPCSICPSAPCITRSCACASVRSISIGDFDLAFAYEASGARAGLRRAITVEAEKFYRLAETPGARSPKPKIANSSRTIWLAAVVRSEYAGEAHVMDRNVQSNRRVV